MVNLSQVPVYLFQVRFCLIFFSINMHEAIPIKGQAHRPCPYTYYVAIKPAFLARPSRQPTNTSLTSITFVFVGPVIKRSLVFSKK